MNILKAEIMRKRKELEDSRILVCYILSFTCILNLFLYYDEELQYSNIFYRKMIKNISKEVN
jgi:hypothetical protein